MGVRLVALKRRKDEYPAGTMGVAIDEVPSGILCVRFGEIGARYVDPRDIVPFVGPLSRDEMETWSRRAWDNGIGVYEDDRLLELEFQSDAKRRVQEMLANPKTYDECGVDAFVRDATLGTFCESHAHATAIDRRKRNER